MKSKWIVTTISLATIVLSLSGRGEALASEENVKVGVIDMQRALQTVESGKMAKSQLEKDFNTKKKQLQSEEASIKKATEEFKKQSLVMSDEARAKKQGELQDRIMRFQELTARSQSEIQQKEQELTQPILKKLQGIIDNIAEKGNYTVILEKSRNNVLYSKSNVDLTSEVISTYDKQNKQKQSQQQD